jgi:demethylmenaquinone methyltransferase/2-methoxy-6-polyprenyl-1,4-benzoquinol methylase
MEKQKGYNLDKFYSKIYKRYDLINKLFTFGLDRKWRRVTIEECLKGNPENVLDVCCGTGDLTTSVAIKSNQKVSVTGFDMNEAMLSAAQDKTKQKCLKNITYIRGNAAEMPFTENSFDRITIGFGFRNLTFENPDKDKHISELFRVLKPGGKILILESGVPENFFMKILYTLHLYGLLIPVGGIISHDFKAYRYLAHSSSKFYTLPELEVLLSDAGFTIFSFRRFMFGASNLIIATK